MRSRYRGWMRCGLALALALPAPVVRAAEDDVPPADLSLSGNDFGGVGLLQTRTARLAPDGQFDFGASVVDPYIRYYLTWTILPRVEATFRYTDVRNRLYSDSPAFSGDQTFKDRGADLKFLLLREGAYLPQIAIGLQDGLGTGQFQGEYLAFSKRWYDLDFSLGLGWGYFAGSKGTFRNPFGLLADRFNRRDDVSAQGGTFRLNNYFAGRYVGVFGGVEWRTPIEGLTLKLEYDPNDFQNEPLGNKFFHDLPINVGANWRPYPFVDVSLGVERGNTAMLRIALRANLHDSGPPKADPPPAPIKPRPPAAAELAAALGGGEGPWWELADAPGGWLLDGWHDEPQPTAETPRAPTAAPRDAAARLFDRLEREGVEIEAVELNQTAAVITVSRLPNGRTVALNRVAQVAAAAIADPVERVTVVETDSGREMRRVTLVTRDIAEAAIVDYVFEGFEDAGLAVESVELSDAEAVIAVNAARGLQGGLQGAPAAALVARVLDAVPMPVARVTILARERGREIGRVSVSRDEARREARLERLFASLAAQGAEPLAINLSHHEATIQVAATNKQQDLQAIGRAALEAMPTPLEAITVIAMADGREVARSTYEPFAPRMRLAVAGAEPPRPVRALLPDPAKRKLAGEIFAELDKAGFRAIAFDLDTRGATVWVTPTKYRQVPRNVGRVARIVFNHVPREVERITVALVAGDYETARISLMRKDLEQAIALKGSPEEVFSHAEIAGGETRRPATAVQKDGLYPRFDWGLRPALTQSIGQPEQFFLYQVNARLSARADLGYGVGVEFAGNRKLFGTLEQARIGSDATLPHVRSDIRSYVREGSTNIERLAIDWRVQPAKDWYARLTGGIFEDMFGGVGGEVLWWPYGSRVAVGAEVFHAQQRTFKQRFTFQDYNVVTGFVNLYYQLPWYNLLATVSAGQYLAGDKGVTYKLTREFDSGIKVSGFFTLTDVPFDVFGEGSFDKGFIVTIPFETFLGSSTQRTGSLGFRPLTKDGGQMMGGAGQTIYGLVAGDNHFATLKDWRRLLD